VPDHAAIRSNAEMIARLDPGCEHFSREMRELKGMSIGYKATEMETRRDGARLLKPIRLHRDLHREHTHEPARRDRDLKSLGADPLTAVPMFESVMDEMARLTRDLRR
jgi:hypothetical protein